MSGTCRDSPNIGHHSVKAPFDIGVPDAGEKAPPVLDIAGLPVFTITCGMSSTSISTSALPSRTRRISSTSRTHSDEVHDLEKKNGRAFARPF